MEPDVEVNSEPRVNVGFWNNQGRRPRTPAEGAALRGTSITRVLTAVMMMLLAVFTFNPAFGEEKHPPAVTHVTVQGEADASAKNARDLAIADALSNALMTAADNYVDSTTSAGKYQTVEKDLLLKAPGLATLVSVESVSVKNGMLCAIVKASVNNAPLVDKLKELGLSRQWKVGVYMPGKDIADPKSASLAAAERAIAQKLVGSGFRVIDDSRRERLGEGGIAGRAAQGDAAALQVIKREYGIDILVAGSASAESVGQDSAGGVTLYRTRARIQARAFYTDTGQILSMTEASADGLEQSKDLSAKQSLTSAGAKAGETLAGDMMIAPAQQSPFVAMKITNFKTESSAADFEKALSELTGVTGVKRRSYSGGALELNVYVKSDFMDLLPTELEDSGIGKKMRVEIDLWSKTSIRGHVSRYKG